MVSMLDLSKWYGKLTRALQTHGTRKKFPVALLQLVSSQQRRSTWYVISVLSSGGSTNCYRVMPVTLEVF
jgi:hypothetical protein